jgi:hypothetical protein
MAAIKAPTEPEVCTIKDCVVCNRISKYITRDMLVQEEHVGRLVSYYEEGWRVGHLEAVSRYGTYQRDNDGHILSVGRCVVRPLPGMYNKRAKDTITVPIEDVKLEASVLITKPAQRIAVDIETVPGPVIAVVPLADGGEVAGPVVALVGEACSDQVLPRAVFAGLDLATKADVALPADSGRSDIAMDLPKAIAMYKAGQSWTEIAVAMGYPRGKGQNRCKRAVEKAGALRTPSLQGTL